MSRIPKRMTFREATDLLAIPMERIAEVTGRTYGTVLGYRNGNRNAPADVYARLAAFMRRHAADLATAADRLEEQAGRMEGK